MNDAYRQFLERKVKMAPAAGSMMARRMPSNRNTFCWARIPQDSGSVLYRLYRRDMRSAVHAVIRNFPRGSDRGCIARELNIARHQLRNTVDEIDLALMGVENA